VKVYIYDTNAFRIVEHYYPDRFPGFWKKFNALTKAGRIQSVREVHREIARAGWKDYMAEYFDQNANIFHEPCPKQLSTVGSIMRDPACQDLVRKKQWLEGAPVADSFLIAAGRHVTNAILVSQETAKIPLVCSKFGVTCIQVRGMMSEEGWKFD
jgi:hypothetical protein